MPSHVASKPVELPTAVELRALLIRLLEEATEKPASHWNSLIGSIERRSIASNPRTNWELAVRKGRHTEPVAQAVRMVRSEHPYVTW